jgi:hypothetical protein
MDYITGNKFKKKCHHSYDEHGYLIHSEPIDNEILKIFVKTDYIHNFFNRKIETPYILFTHNSDLPIDDSYLQYLDNEKLVKWYGQNIMTKHSKLFSIPIGIANEIWEHGNEKVFNEVIEKKLQKERLIYVNFDTKTNPPERNYCLNEIRNNGLDMSNKLPFKKYLEELSKSYFVVSPNGNGVDCHKTWESLYVRTIPIVTKSINISFYYDYPMIVIDDWSKFDLNNFNVELYNKTWESFNTNQLNINNFIN